jgi:hypothetical protein
MKSSCLNEIRVNTTFWKKKTPKETTIGIISRTTKSDRSMTTKYNIQQEVDIDLSSLQSLSDAIFDVDCPDDCSNAGTCNQG